VGDRGAYAWSSARFVLVVDGDVASIVDKASGSTRRVSLPPDRLRGSTQLDPEGRVIVMRGDDGTARPLSEQADGSFTALPVQLCVREGFEALRSREGAWLFRWGRAGTHSSCGPGIAAMAADGRVLDLSPATEASLSPDGLLLNSGDDAVRLIDTSAGTIRSFPEIRRAVLLRRR